MNKRSAVCLLLVLSVPGHTRAETRWERRARERQQATRDVVWPSHEPLMLMLRRGTHPDNIVDIYERQHSPENLRQMAKADVQFARLHFYKGLGLKMEAAEMEKSRQMADLMHQLRMKVSLYVAGTMFAETFYREVPEAVSWEQRDQYNHLVPYSGTQTFRHYPCANQPGYREYMKKVLKKGVEDWHAEQFFFDNVQLQPEPESCRCARCISAFHEYLRRKYPTPEAVKRRFGYPSVDYLQMTEWQVYNRPDDLTTIDDPVLQEWIRFRCESLAKHNIAMGDYIKSLDPGVSVGFNLKGIYGFNRMWLNGVYHPLYDGHADFLAFDVGGMEPRIDSKTGALISEIRSYKIARRLNMSCQNVLHDELNFAVHMAFNYQKKVPRFGYREGPWEWSGQYDAFTPIGEFFCEYSDRYYTETDNKADVVVIRSWPSMAYSIGPTLVPTILTEQVLIQYKVPFDILYDEKMDGIDHYGAVVVPGQESLSQEVVERLLRYVRDGGTLVFTDNTADYNEWREKRAVNPWRGLLEGSNVRWLGKGRLVYIPKVMPAQTHESGAGTGNPEIIVESRGRGHQFPPTAWMLPRNHEAIYRAITDNLRGTLSVNSEAPLTTLMEMLNRVPTRETILHFVNFERGKRLKPFAVSVSRQFLAKAKSVTYLSPEFDDPRKLEFRQVNGRINFTVPETGMYCMLVIGYEAEPR